MQRLRCTCKFVKGVYGNMYPPDDCRRDCAKFKALKHQFLEAPWFSARGMRPWNVYFYLDRSGVDVRGAGVYPSDYDDVAEELLNAFEAALEDRKLQHAVK